MGKLLLGLVVLLIAGAFGVGYWPQRERLGRAEAELAEARRQRAETQSRLESVEAQARLGRLFGQFLALQDAVGAGNYGEAQSLSSAFFDRVRDEAAQTSDVAVRTALDAVLMRRDTVTAGLARGESSVREALVPIERELRRSLGYPLPAPAPAPAAEAARATP
jgi:hypothetical protein